MIAAEQSTFTRIRRLLDQAERDVVAMRSEPQKAVAVIGSVEQAQALLDTLRGRGVDIRAEEGRADSLHGRLLREAELVVRQVGRGGQSSMLAESPLWEEISATAARRRAQVRRKWLIGGAGVALLALLLFVVLPRLFPAPPTANTIAVVQIVGEGNLEGALERALTEQAQAPDDMQIGVWIAALQQQLGREQEADQSWATARARYPDDIGFLSDRVTVMLALGNPADAERSAEQLRGLPNGAALGTYQLGAVRETEQQFSEAIDLYEQAATLAEQEGRPELVVAARTRLATLMQMGP